MTKDFDGMAKEITDTFISQDLAPANHNRLSKMIIHALRLVYIRGLEKAAEVVHSDAQHWAEGTIQQEIEKVKNEIF